MHRAERTIANPKQAREQLVKFFGMTRDYTTINRAEAKDWCRALVARGLAIAMVSMHVKKVRQFFADGVERKLLQGSPFAGL